MLDSVAQYPGLLLIYFDSVITVAFPRSFHCFTGVLNAELHVSTGKGHHQVLANSIEFYFFPLSYHLEN